jgi:hypothetical protein
MVKKDFEKATQNYDQLKKQLELELQLFEDVYRVYLNQIYSKTPA